MPTSSNAAFPADERTPLAAPGSTVTVVAGSSFVICSPQGDIEPGGSQGYFAGDTRLLSTLHLRINGTTPRLLTDDVDEHQVHSVSTVGDPTKPELLVSRRMTVADDLVIMIDVENLTGESLRAILDLNLEADFADLFDVKRGVKPRAGFIGSGQVETALLLTYDSDGFRRGLRIHCDHACEILRDAFRVELEIPARSSTSIQFQMLPESSRGVSLTASVFSRMATDDWLDRLPDLQTSRTELATMWQRSCVDLGSLLLIDPDFPDRPIVAAGSPWFMALFGRDSLITSWSSLLLNRSLQLGTLNALAARQGRTIVPASAEQPGRILHEVRSGEVVLRPGGWGSVYYGTVDATPLFVMALAEYWRWGGDQASVAALLPAAERAISWITDFGDSDGDGFVEYGGRDQSGIDSLANQGWKDSDDAIRHPDGSIAVGPIALVEVQGYCHAALLAMADLREAFQTGPAGPLRTRADTLGRAIDEAFWMDDEDCYAMALDGEKRPVRSVSTNAGHLMWTGTASSDRCQALSARLMRGDMFTGFGLRTLSAFNPAYNPLSYHCGSVWPHDSAIVAAGMLRNGCHDQGRRLATALIDLASCFDGRAPELFGGFSRTRFERPVPYPTSCSPQAWAAAACPLLVRALLGLQPDVPAGIVRLDPQLPDEMRIVLRGVNLGNGHLNIAATGQTLEHVTLPEGLTSDVG